jgi:hypothetical protein
VTALVFDAAGKHLFETGVDRGVLYILNTETGLYDAGFVWNGLTTVKEKPAGAAANPQYADNIKYLNLYSLETFGLEIDAFTYPDEFGQCDGTVSPEAGVAVGQQGRAVFGLSYRTKIGNDANPDAGFRYHMVYGLTASPSERDYATVNDNPAPVAFSWTCDSIPVSVSGMKPTSLITIDSTTVDVTALGTLTDALYGTSGTDPELPLPDTLLALFAGSVTSITLSPATFDGAHTITIPSQAGVTYYVDGVAHAAGTQLLTTGQKKVVSAVANPGYVFNKPVVTEWLFSFVS